MASVTYLNTKGFCFLCLKEAKQVNKESFVVNTLQSLFRHFDISIIERQSQSTISNGGGFGLSISSNSNSQSQLKITNAGKRLIGVTLCEPCQHVNKRFTELFELLEKVRMEIDYFVEGISKNIDEAYKNNLPELQLQQQIMAISDDKYSLRDAQDVFIDKLRKEIAYKSSNIRLTPQLRVGVNKSSKSNHQKDILQKQKEVIPPANEKEDENFEEIDSDIPPNSPLHSAPPSPSPPPPSLSPHPLQSSTEEEEIPKPSETESSTSTSTAAVAVIGKHYIYNKLTGTYDCLSCPRMFINRQNARAHYQIIHFGRRHTCDLCKMQFKLKISLNKHKQKKCPKIPKPPKANANIDNRWKFVRNFETGKFNCPKCPKEFATAKGSIFHYEAIHEKKRFECELCKMAVFNRICSLLAHKIICQETLPQRLEKLAARKDKRIFKFPCNICGKMFTCVSTRNRHKRTVHGKKSDFKTYCCELCGKKFKSLEGMTSHKDSMHLGKRFECDLCDRTYSKRGNLLAHKRLCLKKKRKTNNEEEAIKTEVEEIGNAILEDQEGEGDAIILSASIE